MPTFEMKVEDGLPELHDPAGDDVQTHEVGEELIVTFSPRWVDQTGWKAGDTLEWDLPEGGGMSIRNKSLELRKKVDAMLAAGPEL